MKRLRLSQVELNVSELTLSFLEGRLEEPAVILWAANLPEWRVAERQALDRLIFRIGTLKEPYRTAWAAVFDFWGRPDEETLDEWHLLQLNEPEALTGRAIRIITEAVRPFLSIEDPDRLAALYQRPKRVGQPALRDLIHISVSSGDLVSPTAISLDKVNDVYFLVELAKSLDSALCAGLALYRRYMSDGGLDLPSYLVRRVYFVESSAKDGSNDPDQYSRGFASSTKVLYATVSRLAQLEPNVARGIADGWRYSESGIYRRLWAAWAQSADNVPADLVSAFLVEMQDGAFWDRDHSPEFAELRALRWNSLPAGGRNKIESRLKKGPPLAAIPKGLGKIERADHKRRRSLAEFARVATAGGTVSASAKSWIEDAAKKSNAPVMESVTGDFAKGPFVVSVPLPDGARFGALAEGKREEDLLQALLRDDDFDHDTGGASIYIGDHPEVGVSLLAKAGPDAKSAGAVWKAIGYYVRPGDLNATPGNVDQPTRERLPTIEALVELVANIAPDVAKNAIDPLASFLDGWDRLLGKSPAFLAAIRKLWPVAAEAVNSTDKSAPLGDLVQSSPIGRLTRALFQAFPSRPDPSEFVRTPWPEVLAELGSTAGEAGRQMRYSMLELVDYFHEAAPEWAGANLILPLRDAKGADVELWGGFARGGIPTIEIYDTLGSSLVAAVANTAVTEDARKRLVTVAIWSNLHSRVEGSSTVSLSPDTIQQMLRVGGAEVRAASASALETFLKGRIDGKVTYDQAFAIFRDAFAAIWPKERTLNAPKPAGELAGIPATAPGRYAAMVQIVLPYLVPFDAWSLHYYGVYEGPVGEKTISKIDTATDAEAFLAVLDATVGERERATVPRGLDQALAHILSKAPELEGDRRFQRLLTLSRR